MGMWRGIYSGKLKLGSKDGDELFALFRSLDFDLMPCESSVVTYVSKEDGLCLVFVYI